VPTFLYVMPTDETTAPYPMEGGDGPCNPPPYSTPPPRGPVDGPVVSTHVFLEETSLTSRPALTFEDCEDRLRVRLPGPRCEGGGRGGVRVYDAAHWLNFLS